MSPRPRSDRIAVAFVAASDERGAVPRVGGERVRERGLSANTLLMLKNKLAAHPLVFLLSIG